MKSLLSTSEAIAFVGCAPTTFRSRISKGTLVPSRTVGRTHYFDEATLRGFKVDASRNHHKNKPHHIQYRPEKRQDIAKDVNAEDLKEIIDRWQIHSDDKSSSDVQIGIYTAKIEELEDRLKRMRLSDPERKSVRGTLIRYVGERRRLLRYLQSTDEKRYFRAIGFLSDKHRVA